MSERSLTVQNSVGNPLSHSASLRRAFHISFDDSTPSTSNASLSLNWSLQRSNDSTIHYLDEYRREFTGDSVSDESIDEEEDEPMDASDEYDDMENSIPKYLIFSTGSKTYTPHQIGIKRIRNITFPKKLDPGPSLKERIAAKKAAEQQVSKCTEFNII